MSTAVNINIGSSIRRVIAEKKISQAQLGRLLDKSTTYITRLLNKETIDTETLNNLCALLDYNFYKEYTPELEKKEGVSFITTSPHIGWTISSVLKEKKVTQKELAEALGVSHQEVSRLLKNKTISTDKLVQISNCLDHDFFSCLYHEVVPKEKRTDLVMLTEVEQKVARVLWPGIDVRCPWTPEGRELVRKSIDKLKVIFKEHNIMED